jgi:hypothetical protein
MPSYHDLHLTMHDLPRTSIFNLPFNLEVTCCRVTGWRVWVRDPRDREPTLRAEEYADSLERSLRLDVDGYVIVDSLTENQSLSDVA